MAKRTIKAGSTSNREYVVVRDGNGSPITGLVYNSSGLIAYYVLPGASATSITLATQTVTGAYSSGGFVEVDATHAPGLYRFDVPDAALAASNHNSVVCLSGFSGMAALYLEYDLFAIDPQDSVRLGLTALPNATAGAAGGVPLGVDSSGRVDVLKINGTSQTARDLGASVLISSGTGTGQVSLSSGTVTVGTNSDKTGYALTQTFPTNFSSLGISAGGKINGVALADTLTTYTGNTPQTGDSFARIGSAGAGLTALGDSRVAHLDADISSRTKPADTQAAVTTVTNLTNAPTAGDFTSTMKTSLNAATPAVTVSDKTGFSLSSAGVQAIWDALTSALTTIGSVGKLLVTNIDATISSRTKPADTQAAVTTVGSVSGTVGGVVGLNTSLIDAAISSRSTYAGGDTSGTTTLLSRLTSGRASNLDNLDAAVSTRLATSGYTAPDNSDIAAIKAKTDNLPASPSAVSDIPTANANADALLDRADGIESSWTFRQAMRIMLASLAGKISGAATSTVPIRDVNDTANRITATVDSDGNRTAVTYNKS